MTSKKKILFIITGLVGGGAEKALVNLLVALDKTRYEVELLLVFGNQMTSDELFNIRVYTLFSSAKNIIYKFAKHLYVDLCVNFLIRCLTRRMITKKYDTIISFLEGDSLLYHSFINDKAAINISWVHTDFVENHWSKRHFVKDDEYRAYLTLDKLVFVSEYAKNQFAKVFPLPSSIQQYVCANIINTQEIITKSKEQTDIAKTKFTICSVGRLEEVKGYDMVIDAAKILKDRHIDVDFWIIGTGSQETSLKDKLRYAQCEDMVHFLGYKSNPYPYMRTADVFLSSSYAEGLPLVFCEAQCLGKPIIATRTIGALELLKNNTADRIVDFSASAIANQIEDYVINKWYLNANNSLNHDSMIVLNQIYSNIL